MSKVYFNLPIQPQYYSDSEEEEIIAKPVHQPYGVKVYKTTDIELWSKFRSKQYRYFLKQEREALQNNIIKYPLTYQFFNSKICRFWRELNYEEKRFLFDRDIEINWLEDKPYVNF